MNALYKVSDILRQIMLFRPLTGELLTGNKKPSDLKVPLQELLASLPGGGADINGEIVVNLLDCLDTYQELKRKNASDTEIIRTLIVEELTLEQLSRPVARTQEAAAASTGRRRDGPLAIQLCAAATGQDTGRLSYRASLGGAPTLARQLHDSPFGVLKLPLTWNAPITSAPGL
ncbi:hypothetical protein [Paraburkholderia aspalathi]|uniref:hypothetical protein n=1 Tax=Paraburkholderia aspalathi TaxID=1324617 RepID=UPI0038BB4CE5